MGVGENKMPFLSASPPTTNDRGLGMDSCYRHYYEVPRPAKLASRAFTDIMAVPAATALFQTLNIFLQGQNFSRCM